MIAFLLPAAGIEPTSRYQRTFLRQQPYTIRLSKYLSNSVSTSIAEWNKAIVVRMSSGTVTWVRFPPTGKRTEITLHTFTNMYTMPRFSPSGFFGPYRCLLPTPGLTSEYPICAMCVCVCVYTHIHPSILPPALKIEKTQTTPLTPHAKQQVLS